MKQEIKPVKANKHKHAAPPPQQTALRRKNISGIKHGIKKIQYSILSYARNDINVKLWMTVLFIEPYLFIRLSDTVTIF